jgi:hypothetical protein
MAMAARQNILLSADNKCERCRETPSGGVPVTSPLTEPIFTRNVSRIRHTQANLK